RAPKSRPSSPPPPPSPPPPREPARPASRALPLPRSAPRATRRVSVVEPPPPRQSGGARAGRGVGDHHEGMNEKNRSAVSEPWRSSTTATARRSAASPELATGPDYRSRSAGLSTRRRARRSGAGAFVGVGLQRRPGPLEIRRRVHLDQRGRAAPWDDADRDAVLERPQLLERLASLERGRRRGRAAPPT